MKLDFDCIRDIMLILEAQTDFSHLLPQDLFTLLPQYSAKTLEYTCLRMHEAGFINLYFMVTPVQDEPVIQYIGDLTFSGHEFLADIKPKNTWSKLQPVLRDGWSASSKVLSEAAAKIGIEALLIQLKLLP